MGGVDAVHDCADRHALRAAVRAVSSSQVLVETSLHCGRPLDLLRLDPELPGHDLRLLVLAARERCNQVVHRVRAGVGAALVGHPLPRAIALRVSR
jgi:hypothetical protein